MYTYTHTPILYAYTVRFRIGLREGIGAQSSRKRLTGRCPRAGALLSSFSFSLFLFLHISTQVEKSPRRAFPRGKAPHVLSLSFVVITQRARAHRGGEKELGPVFLWITRGSLLRCCRRFTTTASPPPLLYSRRRRRRYRLIALARAPTYTLAAPQQQHMHSIPRPASPGGASAAV